MPPRQTTTFDKKGKGTTTYRDYNPAQERANAQLERFIRDNQDKKNQSAGIESILQDMPEKKAAFVKRNTRADGTLNEAAKSMLSFYADDRPEYSRELNRLRTSSPEMREAYAKRFPVANFMMEVAPRFIPGIGALFTADRGMKANAEKERIMNTPVNRPDGGFKNFVDFFAQGMTPDQAKNTEIISGESLRLAPQDIFNKSQPMTKEQEAIVMPEDNIFDPEKAAMDASLPAGDIVYNPVDERQNKVDFINEVFGTNFTTDSKQSGFITEEATDRLFERAQAEQGDETVAGQFTLEPNESPVNLSGVTDYEEEFEDTFGVPMKGNIEAPSLTRPGEIERGLGDRLTRESFALDNNIPLDQIGEVYPKTTTYPLPSNIMKNGDLTTGYYNPTGDFSYGDYGIDDDIIYSDRISEMPKLGQEIRTAPGMKDGGLTDNYGNMSTHEKLMRMASKMYG